jgi:Phage terminase large subunit
MNGKRLTLWAPQRGPQKALVDCPLPEIFFGGARGGGKTDGVLGKWALKERRYKADFNAIMFRRTTVSSEDAIERAAQLYLPLGAKFNASRSIFRMPNGGRVSFRYLETIKDADEWQGRNVTDAWVEEAGQYADPAPIDRLNGVLRSAAGVPEQLILTANPGGAGQMWLRERYQLVPFPKLPFVIHSRLPDGSIHKRAVIPSRLEDNKILLRGSPGYRGRLHLVGSAALVKAWLDGDWSVVPGAFFDCWSEKRHVIEPIPIPKDWLRFRAMDWGSASPFSVGWYAVVADPVMSSAGQIPRGALIKYREWYGAEGGKGLKLQNVAIGKGIAEREKGETIAYGVLDPSCFNENGGPSIAEQIEAGGPHFEPADNTRVPKEGAISGWAEMRSRLIGLDHGKGPGGAATPSLLYFFNSCRDSIRTIPVLQHDPQRAEDLDTNAEDHAADETRYACMSRPWITGTNIVKPPVDRFRRDDRDEDSGDWKTV